MRPVIGIYPVREIYYWTKIFLKSPKTDNLYGNRNLRMAFFTEIQEFDRITEFMHREKEVIKQAFPWYDLNKPGELEELGTLEEALRIFEKEVAPLAKKRDRKEKIANGSAVRSQPIKHDL